MQSHGNDNPHTLRGPYSFPVLPNVQLEITRGQARRRIRPIDVPVFLIGQASDCDLVIGDPQFPEVHTYIFVTTQSVSVRHLGEGPELLVNGVLIKSTQLNDGDLIQTGSYEFSIAIDHRSYKQRVQSRQAASESSKDESFIDPTAVTQELVREVRDEILSSPRDAHRTKRQKTTTESRLSN